MEDMGAITEYERKRLQRIAENNARIALLGIPQLVNHLKQDVQAFKRPKQKATNRKEKGTSEPTRKSDRLGILQEEREAQAQLRAMANAEEKRKLDVKDMEAALMKRYKGWDPVAAAETAKLLVDRRVTPMDAQSGFELITAEMAREWGIDDLSFAKMKMSSKPKKGTRMRQDRRADDDSDE